jgi:hypothetical protein
MKETRLGTRAVVDYRTVLLDRVALTFAYFFLTLCAARDGATAAAIVLGGITLLEAWNLTRTIFMEP